MTTLQSFNPYVTTNAQGYFGVQSDGLTQGVMMDDPVSRFAIAQGYLASTETIPMWGGIAISEYLPASGSTSPFPANGNTGNSIARATSNSGITGFSVFNQAHNGINWPQSQVPTLMNGMTVEFVRFGSGARIAVAMDPGLVSLDGNLISSQVSWDFNNQRLAAYDASSATIAVSSLTASWSSATGLFTMTVVTSAASDVEAVGDYINISGVTNTGTGGAAFINGNWQVTQFTDNEHFQFQIPGTSSGQIGTIGGTIVLNQGTGALNARVLQIKQGNSRTVNWSPTALTANWNNSDTCALILI